MKKSFFVLICIVFILSFVLVGLVGLNYRNTSRIYTSSIVCNEYYYSSNDSLGQAHIFQDHTEDGENLVVLDYVPGMQITLSPQAYPLDASILAESNHPYAFYSSSDCIKMDELFELGVISFTKPGTATIRISPVDRADISTTVLIRAKGAGEPVVSTPPPGESKWLELADTSILSCEIGQDFDIANLGVMYVNEGIKTPLMPGEYTVSGVVDTETMGKYALTVTYGDLTLSLTVSVAFPYEIDAFDWPEFVDRYYSNLKITQEQSKFTNHISYVVGDDNPFFFLPRISAWDKNDKHIYLKSYVSISTLQQKTAEGGWMLLEGDALASIVNLDETASSYDFTEAAIGNTYLLTVSPVSAPSFSISFEFTVVDGWNVYTAKDFSRLDNTNPAWTEYKTTNGIEDIAIAGLVFQNNLSLVVADLPADYFHTSTSQTLGKEGWMRDDIHLYTRTLADAETFTLYGNSFTLDISALPTVPKGDEEAGGYGAFFSSVSLMQFIGNNLDKTFSGNTFTTIQDLNIIGNACMVTEDTAALEKGLGGATAINSQSVNMCIENVIIKMTYIAFMHGFDTNVTIKNCRAFDSLQTALYVMGGTVVNVENSIMKYCGGPAIIAVFWDPDNPDSPEMRAPEINLAADSILENPIAGDEVWFVNFGLTPYINQIHEISELLTLGCKGINEAFKILGLEQVPVKSLTYKNAENINVMTVVGTLIAEGTDAYGSDLYGDIIYKGESRVDLDAVDALRAKITAAYGETVAKEAVILEANGMLLWTDGTGLYVDFEGNVKTSFVDYFLRSMNATDVPALQFLYSDTITIHLGTVAVVLELCDVVE